MFKIQSAIRRLRVRASRHSIPLQSVESFRFLVRRERFRADRCGRQFSLIAIRFLDAAEARIPDEEDLIRWLQQELRITDDVGRLDDGRVAVLLPDTGSAGAEVVADRIRLECATRELPNELCVSVYPDATLPSSEAAAAAEERPSGAPLALMMSLFILRTPWWKRGVDLLLAGIALILLAPLMIAIAVAIRITSPGPAIYSQYRSGLGGRPYRIHKFRTMCQDAEIRQTALLAQSDQDGPAFKMAFDPRVTPLGRLLRKSSLDELPQLWNVVCGEMSLVGPRPLPVYETAACEPWQRYRLDVTPGITCIWQVYGRSRVRFVDWVRMDIEYIRSRSLLQDAHLLGMTLPAVFSGRGAV